jgi:hypothetical protein
MEQIECARRAADANHGLVSWELRVVSGVL